MKRFFLISIFVFLSFFAYSQSQDAENFSESENKTVSVISKINFSGLKKTKNSYIQSKVKKFIGKPLSDETLHDLETAIQLEEVFNNIKIEVSEPLSVTDENSAETLDGEVEINVSVEEKISFIPLPFAAASSSGFLAGGIIMDTNAFGRKDTFFVGGFYSSTSVTGLASFSKQPKDHGIPGFSLFVSAAKSVPEIVDLEEELSLKYKEISFSGALGLTEKIGENFSFSTDYGFRSCQIDDEEDFEGLSPESVKVGTAALKFGYSKSDWNGFFMSNNSASVRAEAGLCESEDKDFRYPLGFSFTISGQHPIFTPRLRFYLRSSGFYGKKNHLSFFKDGKAASVSILPDDFKTEKIVGGNAGLEIAVAKFSWAMLSVYGDYQLVYTKDFLLPGAEENLDNRNDYILMHGPNGGIRLYLAKIAFPALAMSLSYNATKHYWQGAVSLGMNL